MFVRYFMFIWLVFFCFCFCCFLYVCIFVYMIKGGFCRVLRNWKFSHFYAKDSLKLKFSQFFCQKLIQNHRFLRFVPQSSLKIRKTDWHSKNWAFRGLRNYFLTHWTEIKHFHLVQNWRKIIFSSFEANLGKNLLTQQRSDFRGTCGLFLDPLNVNLTFASPKNWCKSNFLVLKRIWGKNF